MEWFRAAHLLTKEGKDGQPFLHFDFATIVEQPPIVNEVEESSETELGFYALTGLAQQRMAFSAEPALVRYKRFHPSFELTALSTPEHMAAHMAQHYPRMLDKGRKQLECFRMTGHLSWLDWNTKHWGTKWNSYETELRKEAPGELVVAFQTAWSPPEPVFQALTARYPELELVGVSHDEGGWAYRWEGSQGAFSAEHIKDQEDVELAEADAHELTLAELRERRRRDESELDEAGAGS